MTFLAYGLAGFSGLVGFIGLLMIPGARRRSRAVALGETTVGQVVAQPLVDAEMRHSTIRYEIRGQSFEVNCTISYGLSTGDSVRLRYDPSRPAEARRDVSLSVWDDLIAAALPTAVGFIGAVVFVMLGLSGVL